MKKYCLNTIISIVILTLAGATVFCCNFSLVKSAEASSLDSLKGKIAGAKLSCHCPTAKGNAASKSNVHCCNNKLQAEIGRASCRERV